jgi:hypothetical protein
VARCVVAAALVDAVVTASFGPDWSVAEQHIRQPALHTGCVCVCVCVLFRRCVRKLVAVWTTENQIMRLLLGTGVTFGIFTPLLVATGIHHDT